MTPDNVQPLQPKTPAPEPPRPRALSDQQLARLREAIGQAGADILTRTRGLHGTPRLIQAWRVPCDKLFSLGCVELALDERPDGYHRVEGVFLYPDQTLERFTWNDAPTP